MMRIMKVFHSIRMIVFRFNLISVITFAVAKTSGNDTIVSFISSSAGMTIITILFAAGQIVPVEFITVPVVLLLGSLLFYKLNN